MFYWRVHDCVPKNWFYRKEGSFVLTDSELSVVVWLVVNWENWKGKQEFIISLKVMTYRQRANETEIFSYQLNTAQYNFYKNKIGMHITSHHTTNA